LSVFYVTFWKNLQKKNMIFIEDNLPVLRRLSVGFPGVAKARPQSAVCRLPDFSVKLPSFCVQWTQDTKDHLSL
jgi:hypothetical protein